MVRRVDGAPVVTRCPRCGLEIEIVAAEDVRRTEELIDALDPVARQKRWARAEELSRAERLERERGDHGAQ
jgi:16S rRNA C1402 (ribose-2'-O) methylase RsmI